MTINQPHQPDHTDHKNRLESRNRSIALSCLKELCGATVLLICACVVEGTIHDMNGTTPKTILDNMLALAEEPTAIADTEESPIAPHLNAQNASVVDSSTNVPNPESDVVATQISQLPEEQ